MPRPTLTDGALQWLQWILAAVLWIQLCLLLMWAGTAGAVEPRLGMRGIAGQVCSHMNTGAKFFVGATPDVITTARLMLWAGFARPETEFRDTSDDWIHNPDEENYLSWCYEPWEQEAKTFIVSGYLQLEQTALNGVITAFQWVVDTQGILPGNAGKSLRPVGEKTNIPLPTELVTMFPGDCIGISRASFVPTTVQPQAFYINLEEIECERTLHPGIDGQRHF